MTEQEYILAKAQGSITAAINILRDLPPEKLTSIMTKEEYHKVMNQLYGWQGKLFVTIEIKQD